MFGASVKRIEGQFEFDGQGLKETCEQAASACGKFDVDFLQCHVFGGSYAENLVAWYGLPTIISMWGNGYGCKIHGGRPPDFVCGGQDAFCTEASAACEGSNSLYGAGFSHPQICAASHRQDKDDTIFLTSEFPINDTQSTTAGRSATTLKKNLNDLHNLALDMEEENPSPTQQNEATQLACTVATTLIAVGLIWFGLSVALRGHAPRLQLGRAWSDTSAVWILIRFSRLSSRSSVDSGPLLVSQIE